MSVPRAPTLTETAARRAALAATGLTDSRPAGAVNRRHLTRVLDRIRLIQLDSVNVAVRAHYMPLYSRLGPYPRRLVDDAAWRLTGRRPRLLCEYWAHEASLVPVADWPLLRWRMRHFAANQGRWPAHHADPDLVEKVLATIDEHGALPAGAIERALGEPATGRVPGGWWNRSEVKRACEWLFAIGELTTATREGFERHYDRPARVLPPEVLAADPDDEHAGRELTLRAADALGVATEPDLRDYYRLPPAMSKRAVHALVAGGELEPVTVRGWSATAYRPAGARQPRKTAGRALLCPFDPLIWNRPRTERLFGFRYRIEIYTPARQRVHGYYVFPFLLGDQLVARVDLKSDRAAGVLRVRGSFAEDGVDRVHVAGELAAELRVLAGWLGLDDVVVDDHGDLAARLRAAAP